MLLIEVMDGDFHNLQISQITLLTTLRQPRVIVCFSLSDSIASNDDIKSSRRSLPVPVGSPW